MGEQWGGFDLSDLIDNEPQSEPQPIATATAATTGSDTQTEPSEVEQWADAVVSQATSKVVMPGPMIYDIETGPLSEDALRAAYREKSLDEFADTCDKRWKRETVEAKYKEYLVAAWDEYVARAALSPVTGRVLLIGLLVGDKPLSLFDDGENVSDDDCDGERRIIEEFWDFAYSAIADKQPLIGHNSNAFDLPFLVRRSWILGVQVPREVRQGRYWNPLFRDTMEMWNCGERAFVKLNDVAAAFGVGQKTEGVHGRDFAKLWFGKMPAETWGTADEQRLKAIEYNLQDIRLTAAVAGKMGMV